MQHNTKAKIMKLTFEYDFFDTMSGLAQKEQNLCVKSSEIIDVCS